MNISVIYTSFSTNAYWFCKLLPKEGCMFKLLDNNYYIPTATEVAIG